MTIDNVKNDAGDPVRTVSLSASNWLTLIALALTIISLVISTLWNVYDLAAETRSDNATFKADIDNLKREVSAIQADVRELVKAR